MNRKQAEHDRTVLPRIQALLAQGRSRREIAQQLQHDGVPTARRGGTWTHIAVGRILARAERTPPQEASPPPPPTEPPSAQAEPPPAPAPQLQKIEEQIGNAMDQLSARVQKSEEQLGSAMDQLSTRVQKSEEQLGSAVDQMGGRLQNKLGTVESQMDERLTGLERLSTWLWFRPAAIAVAVCLAVGLGAWALTEALAARIDSQIKKLAELKSDIETQQATLRELEQQTWGVGFVEAAGSQYITWPGHYRPPFKGAGSNPTYAGKWVAELAEE